MAGWDRQTRLMGGRAVLAWGSEGERAARARVG